MMRKGKFSSKRAPAQFEAVIHPLKTETVLSGLLVIQSLSLLLPLETVLSFGIRPFGFYNPWEFEDDKFVESLKVPNTQLKPKRKIIRLESCNSSNSCQRLWVIYVPCCISPSHAPFCHGIRKMAEAMKDSKKKDLSNMTSYEHLLWEVRWGKNSKWWRKGEQGLALDWTHSGFHGYHPHLRSFSEVLPNLSWPLFGHPTKVHSYSQWQLQLKWKKLYPWLQILKPKPP